MLFTYEYRTADNVRHAGTVRAADRDAAFSALRARGIRPFSIAEAPGFLNKFLGKGKRWTLIAVLALALVASLVYAFRTSQPARTSSDRHQIYGDPAILAELESTGFASVFDKPGERFLARYARPGIILSSSVSVTASELTDCLKTSVPVRPDDPREIRELKAIVNGMKDELKEFLSNGETIESYLGALNARQQEESTIYTRTVGELEKEPDLSVWEQKNAQLRALGLRTVPRPRKPGNR